MANPVVVLASATTYCPLCSGDETATFSVRHPGSQIEVAAPAGCAHCGDPWLPVVLIPAYQDKKRAS